MAKQTQIEVVTEKIFTVRGHNAAFHRRNNMGYVETVGRHVPPLGHVPALVLGTMRFGRVADHDQTVFFGNSPKAVQDS